MHDNQPMLHMVCGKVAAGKSTLCAALAREPATIVIAQDHWMSKLFPEELVTVADYVRLVPRLRAAMGPHVADLLHAGLSVILDWPANTVASRAWMREIADRARAAHRLHFLDVPDAVCLERLRSRNAQGLHEYKVTPSQFEELTRLFEPPTAAEGFAVSIHSWR